MRGTPRNQIGSIIKVSEIIEIGTSKFGAQAKARFMGAVGSHQVGQSTGIYSKSSKKTYPSVWNQFAEFAMGELGVKNLENTSSEHVRAFLEHRIDQGLAKDTWDKEASALNKFAVALNRVSERLERGTSYDFSAAINSLRSTAKAELHENKESRAYDNPAEIIRHLQEEKYLVAASLQHQGGARISEIENLKPQQFLGYGNDRITGETVGRIYLDNCKGGQDRIISVAPDTYDRALSLVETEGSFKIDQNEYRRELREACEKADEEYNGSHGLRWNFARERVEECQEHGLIYEQALSETSEDMGHHRPEITEHYLR